jgi:uncharacterized protein YcbX
MRIIALNIYPIKGCRGVPLRSGAVDRLGLVGDRRLMVVDDSGQFVSQREIAALATIQPVLDGESVTVSAPGHDVAQICINRDGPRRAVSVWGNDGIIAADQGNAAAAWFTAVLKAPCRLVSVAPETHNRIDAQFSPRADAETAFTDGYPIMAALQESLDDLNTRLERPVPMERFRPSVVVSGATAWSEDDWRLIRFGDLVCDVVKPCARCVVTTTDQLTGERNERQEPLRTLATFRTISGLGAIFGQNVVPRSTGMLRVGELAELQ